MEERLRFLYKQGDFTNLAKYVRGLSAEQMCLELRDTWPEENGFLILQILFQGFSNSLACQEKKMKIYSEVLSSIKEKNISSRLANKLVSVLVSDVRNLTFSHVESLTNNCLQIMQNDQGSEENVWWKEFIPQLLNIIMRIPKAENDEAVAIGNEFKNQIILTVISNEWNKNVLINIASMFVDVPLSPEEHLKVVNKLCKFIYQIKCDEIPPLIHQLLQITREQNSMLVFKTLAEFFEKNLYSCIEDNESEAPASTLPSDELPLAKLQTVERTVVYYIYASASNLNPKSVKDFVKILRDCSHHPQFVLRPFFFTLSLCMTSISYALEEEILGLLTSAIVRLVTEEDKIFDSAWLDSIIPSTVKVEEVLYKVSHNSCRDISGVLKGLIDCAFSLLGAKIKGKQSQISRVRSIGSTLLMNLIKKYPHVTDEIIQNLINEISQMQNSKQYADCLCRIANKWPFSLLNSSAVIMQLLGNICSRVSSNIGHRILDAMLPVTKIAPAFRNTLIIFLRKALFSDQGSREMAVYAFLELLKDLRISDVKTLSQSTSQSYVGFTQIYSGPCGASASETSNEGLCLEISTILRQVFHQHNQVKIQLYKGLVNDSLHANTILCSHLLDNLVDHFMQFLRGTEEIPPLDLNKIICRDGSSVIIKEPIGHLLLGMASMAANSEEGSAGRTKICDMLNRMCDSMAESDISHFELEKDGGDTGEMDALENQAKYEQIRQILAVYEALMGFTLYTWDRESLECGRKLNALFKGYSRLSDYAKCQSKTFKKNGTDKNHVKKQKLKTQIFKAPPTILNFKCAWRLLAILNEIPVNWATKENIAILKGKTELHRYAYGIALELLLEAHTLSSRVLYTNPNTLRHILSLGKILYERCLSNLPDLREFDIHCAAAAMECLCEFLNLVLHRFSSRAPEFFNELGIPSKDLNVQLKIVLDNVVQQLADTLEAQGGREEEESKGQMPKLCSILISISSILVDSLPKGEMQTVQAIDRIKQFCREMTVQSPSVAKALLTLYLKVHSKHKVSSHGLIQNLVLCLYDSMPLIDQEVEVSSHENYAIVNPRTASSCLMVLCEVINSMNDEVEWMLARCKAEILILTMTNEKTVEATQEELEKREREICRHLNFILKILGMICMIAVPPGILADAVLKQIGNVYVKLVLATKYFFFKFVKHQRTFLNARFDKTVRMADHELSKNMYCLTEHIISDGAAKTEDPQLKKHKKDSTTLKNKILKETKIIPKVIFEKEKFQKYILQLSKKTKVDLSTKNTMARDYRLYAKQVKEIIDQENIFAEEILMDVTETSESENRQPSKKLKTQD